MWGLHVPSAQWTLMPKPNTWGDGVSAFKEMEGRDTIFHNLFSLPHSSYGLLWKMFLLTIVLLSFLPLWQTAKKKKKSICTGKEELFCLTVWKASAPLFRICEVAQQGRHRRGSTHLRAGKQKRRGQRARSPMPFGDGSQWLQDPTLGLILSL